MKGDVEGCLWCEYNGNSCKGFEGTCDFRRLPLEKEAILKRLKVEWDEVQRLKEKITNSIEKKNGLSSKDVSDKDYRDVYDKSEGMKIMIRVLNEKLNVSLSEMKDFLGLEEMRFADKVRMMKQLKRFHDARKSKKN